jgi:hypothetical protein
LPDLTHNKNTNKQGTLVLTKLAGEFRKTSVLNHFSKWPLAIAGLYRYPHFQLVILNSSTSFPVMIRR